jgi:hypothetical protein
MESQWLTLAFFIAKIFYLDTLNTEHYEKPILQPQG